MMILDIMVTIGDLFLTMAQIDMLDVSQDDGTGQITKRCKNYDPSKMRPMGLAFLQKRDLFWDDEILTLSIKVTA